MFHGDRLQGKLIIVDYLLRKHIYMDKSLEDALRGALLHFIDNISTYEICREIFQNYGGQVDIVEELNNILSLDHTKNMDVDSQSNISRINMSGKKSPKPWAREEDIRLLNGILRCGLNDWKMIQVSFGSIRSVNQCYQRWHRVLSPCISKQHWTNY